MSNKPFDKLNEIDRRIRKTFNTGMYCGTVLTIEFISGFELFNTKRYHNYETFSNGYRIKVSEDFLPDMFGGMTVEAEDLDDALLKLEIKMLKAMKAKK